MANTANSVVKRLASCRWVSSNWNPRDFSAWNRTSIFPSSLIFFNDLIAFFIGDHDEIVPRRQLQTGDPKEVTTDLSRSDQGARGGNRQAPEKIASWRERTVCARDVYMAFDGDMERDVVRVQIRKPRVTNEFSVAQKALDGVGPKHVDALIEELETLAGVGIALFRQK